MITIAQSLADKSEALNKFAEHPRSKNPGDQEVDDLVVKITSMLNASFRLCFAEKNPNDFDKTKCKELANKQVSWDKDSLT